MTRGLPSPNAGNKTTNTRLSEAVNRMKKLTINPNLCSPPKKPRIDAIKCTISSPDLDNLSISRAIDDSEDVKKKTRASSNCETLQLSQQSNRTLVEPSELKSSRYHYLYMLSNPLIYQNSVDVDKIDSTREWFELKRTLSSAKKDLHVRLMHATSGRFPIALQIQCLYPFVICVYILRELQRSNNSRMPCAPLRWTWTPELASF